MYALDVSQSDKSFRSADQFSGRYYFWITQIATMLIRHQKEYPLIEHKTAFVLFL